MTRNLLALGASVLALLALAGCSSESTDETQSSANDIVAGDQRSDGTGAAYGTEPAKEAPLPDLDGEGAQGSVGAKKLIRLPGNLNVKPVLDFPRPLIERPSDEQLPH